MERKQLHQEQLSEYQLILDNHYNPIRKKLSDQLRRLNIAHTRDFNCIILCEKSIHTPELIFN